jgi:hypothetical protein
VNGDIAQPRLEDVVNEIFRGGRDRLTRAEIQVRVKELDLPAVATLASSMPEGTYERYQVFAVLDQIDREEGLVWRAAA